MATEEQNQLKRKLLTDLRDAFDSRLIAEVWRYGGLPHLPPEEVQLRQAISALLLFEFPEAYPVVESTS